MSDQALRSVFAELGFDFDDSSIQRANAMVDKAVAKVRELAKVTGLADRAEDVAAARRTAREALRHKQAVEAKADAEKARALQGKESEVELQGGLFAQLRALAAQAEAARRDAREAELKRAHQAAARQALGLAPLKTSDPFGRGSATDDRALGFGGKLGAGQWKKAADAAKQTADRIEKAVQGPVEGLAGLLARANAVAANTLGRAMPASVTRFAEKLGLAKGNTLALGQTLLEVSRMGAGAFAALAVGTVAFVRAFAAEAEALRETAREARITSTQLQELQYAGTVSGVGADRLTRSITTLGQKLRDVNNHAAGSGQTVALLRRLGVAARDAAGNARDPIAVMIESLTALERVSSRRRRARVAEQLGLDPRLLTLGARGLRELMAEARRYGEGVTPEATEAARRFTIEQARLQRGLLSLRSSIFTQLSPTFEGLMEKGARLAGWFANVTRGTHFFQHAVRNLGIALAVAAIPALAAWSPLTATFLGIAAAALVTAAAMDDLQGFLAGNSSFTGELTDRFLVWIGVGSRSHEVVQGLTEAWHELSTSMEWFNEILARIPVLANAALDTLLPLTAIRHLFGGDNIRVEALGGDDREGYTEGASGTTPPPPETPAQVAARERAARNQPPPRQVGFDGEELAPGGGRQVERLRGRRVAIPATRTVAAPGAGGSVTTHVTQRNEGDRNTFNIHGQNTDDIMRRLVPMLDERDRRRNAERSPREAQG